MLPQFKELSFRNVASNKLHSFTKRNWPSHQTLRNKGKQSSSPYCSIDIDKISLYKLHELQLQGSTEEPLEELMLESSAVGNYIPCFNKNIVALLLEEDGNQKTHRTNNTARSPTRVNPTEVVSTLISIQGWRSYICKSHNSPLLGRYSREAVQFLSGVVTRNVHYQFHVIIFFNRNCFCNSNTY